MAHRGTNAILTAAAIIAALLLDVGSSAAGTTPPDGPRSEPASKVDVPPPSEPKVKRVTRAEIVRFRTDFGFPTEGPGLPVQEGDYPTENMEYGVPMTDAETVEMNRMADFQNSVTGVAEVLGAHKDEVAGAYFDYSTRGRLVVQFARAIRSELRDAIAARVPKGGEVIYTVVDHSFNELSTAHAKVDRAIDAIRAAGIPISGVGHGNKDARVRVYVVERTPGDHPTVAALAGVPSSTLVLREKPYEMKDESREDSPGQFKSGLRIRPAPGSIQSCTSAFGARDSLNRYYLLSAGHCSLETGQLTWYHNTTRIGDAVFRQEQDNIDAMALRTPGKQWASHEVWVALDNRIVVTSHRRSSEFLSFGQQGACISGGKTNTSCGFISDGYYTSTTPGIPTLTDQFLSTYNRDTGDSGAGVWWHGGVALGIHIRPGPVATKVDNVLARWGLTLQLTHNPVAMRSRYSGHCLDVQWNGTANGSQLWQWGCNNGSAQAWMIRFNNPNQLTKVFTNKCVDFDLNTNYNGGKAQLWDCLGPNQMNQLWYLERVGTSGTFFRIRNAWNNKCIDVRGPSTAEGAFAQQWDCVGDSQSNQQWYLSPTPY